MCLKQTKVFISVLSFFALLSGLILSIPASADESVVTEVTLSVPVSCSLSGTGMNSHTAEVINGRTVSDIGLTTIKAYCNDTSGFAIYAIGYTDDTYGKTVLTDSELGSTYDIATSSTVVDATSSWSMKLTSVTGTYAPTIASSFSSYQAVPAHYTKVAYYTASTDTGTSATGSSLNTTYKVHISPTQAAGNYIGQVKYTLIHPNMVDDSNAPVLPLRDEDCPVNSICYAPNAEDIVGSMESISNVKLDFSSKAGVQSVTSNAEAPLIAQNYSRPGYGFAGWSTDFEADNTSTIYGPNEIITVGDLSTNGMILYPVWIASAGNIQNWSRCNSLTTAPTSGRATLASMTALTDTRDGNVYTVARLATGKCWMTENLRLEAENSYDSTKAQGYGSSATYGNFTGLAHSENSYFYNSTTANSRYSIDGSNNTINIGSGDDAGYRFPRYNNDNSNRNLTASYNSNDGTHHHWYGYGNYYTWAAAVASTSNYSQNNYSVSTSICPYGWRLPTGGQTTVNTSADFYVLTKALMGGTEPSNNSGGLGSYSGTVDGVDQGIVATKVLLSFPNNFVGAGDYYYSGYIDRGSSSHYGDYITRTTRSGSAPYAFVFGIFNDSSSVWPGNIYNGNKSYGTSVRCISSPLPVLPGSM